MTFNFKEGDAHLPGLSVRRFCAVLAENLKGTMAVRTGCQSNSVEWKYIAACGKVPAFNAQRDRPQVNSDNIHRLKRLKIRARLRGTRESNIILATLASVDLPDLDQEEIAIVEQFLLEDDTSVLDWVTSAQDCPPEYQKLVRLLQERAAGKSLARKIAG